MNLVRLILSFFKVGIIGFGGGNALIPVIRHEIIERHNAMSEDDYTKHTVIANITPGALPPKMATTCGMQLTGPVGSVLACLAVTFPGVAATVGILTVFSLLDGWVIDYLNFAGLGVGVFIMYLLLEYVGRTVRRGNFHLNIRICAFATLATCGKEVLGVADLLLGQSVDIPNIPFFDLSMIHIMIVSFMLIACLPAASGRLLQQAVYIILTISYALSAGKRFGALPWAQWTRISIYALFLVWLLSRWIRRQKNPTARLRMGTNLWVGIGLFFILALGAAAASSSGSELWEKWMFLQNVIISTITSFGGGEAYVAVADGVFIQSGLCPPDLFYGRIVPVANALPGPILVKIAAGIGFEWGRLASGSVYAGFWAATAAMLCAIGSCCAIALVIYGLYEQMKDSKFLLSLKAYILPVICGTLISTTLAMIYETMRLTQKYEFAPGSTFAATLAGIALTFAITHLCHIHDLVLLVFWACAGMGTLYLLG